jgi:hypothetical protein
MTEFMNPAGAENVPVLLATAASSAAIGAVASYSVLVANGYEDDLPWELAYELSDLAVPVTLASGVQSGIPDGQTSAELAASKFARLADGGYLDNSAVAQLVSFLQANDQDSNFQVVAFDNVQDLYSPTSDGMITATPVGLDIALLFGEGGQNQVCAGSGADKFCVSVPAQQIFAADPLGTTAATWNWTSPGATGPTLLYTQYSVTTVENPTFGLTAGSNGVLHVFTCVWPAADTAPFNGSSDFDAYNAMLAAIRSGLQANSNEGLEHLRAALAGTQAN